MEVIFSEDYELPGGAGLFAYPGQCNFSGVKYPLEWSGEVRKKGNWDVLVDAASLVASSRLDLSKSSPDYVCISFYKIFGLPTGLGALLVRAGSEEKLQKSYFGGGTVLMTLAGGKMRKELRPTFHERFEDGTINFLSIVQLGVAIDYFQKLIPGSISISYYYFESCMTFKAILRVLSNHAVLALLNLNLPLLKSQSNNEVLRDLIIPVISP
jgi:molybdenum cofactor sulfurtransferase